VLAPESCAREEQIERSSLHAGLPSQAVIDLIDALPSTQKQVADFAL
jgi:hypothetical protein